MKRKAIITFATLLGAAGGTIGAHAAPADGWYGGIGLGNARNQFGGGQIDSALANQGAMGSASLDRSATSYNLFGGYQFGPHFAVEGGYVYLGKFDYSSNITSPAADTVNGHLQVQGVDAAAVGILPFGEKWSAYGKAGALYAKTVLDASSTGAVPVSDVSHRGTSPLLGAGIGYDFTQKVSLRAEADRYFKVGDTNTTGRGDIDQYSLNLVYRFQ